MSEQRWPAILGAFICAIPFIGLAGWMLSEIFQRISWEPFVVAFLVAMVVLGSKR